jgi:hypothetical protein
MLSDNLQDALGMLEVYDAEFLSDRASPINLIYPYLQMHHQKSLLVGPRKRLLTPSQQLHIEALAGYLDEHVSPEYTEAIS